MYSEIFYDKILNFFFLQTNLINSLLFRINIVSPIFDLIIVQYRARTCEVATRSCVFLDARKLPSARRYRSGSYTLPRAWINKERLGRNRVSGTRTDAHWRGSP